MLKYKYRYSKLDLVFFNILSFVEIDAFAVCTLQNVFLITCNISCSGIEQDENILKVE